MNFSLTPTPGYRNKQASISEYQTEHPFGRKRIYMPSASNAAASRSTTFNHLKNMTANSTNPNSQQAKFLVILYLMCCVVIVFWQYPITYVLLYPFMLIGTVFHEFGHAFMVCRNPKNLISLLNCFRFIFFINTDSDYGRNGRRHSNQPE